MNSSELRLGNAKRRQQLIDAMVPGSVRPDMVVLATILLAAVDVFQGIQEQLCELREAIERKASPLPRDEQGEKR